MTNLNTIIEISNLCRQNNIEISINSTGIVLTAFRNGEMISKRYELDILNKVIKDLPLEIIIDMFLEECVLNFRKAVN